MLELRNRRGATMVVVAMLIFVLVGVAGIAVDFSRMYLFKAELQTTADASAMAGAVELLRSQPTQATGAALTYRDYNVVNKTDTAQMDSVDVEPGRWDIAAGTFTVLADWTDPQLNAIRATARYPGGLTLARVFGSNSVGLSATAIGAIGYVGGSSCLKPWAVSYQSMLKSLYENRPPIPDAATYELTQEDIDSLATNRNTIAFALDNSTQVSGGNIQQVKLDPDWNGNDDYKAAITEECYATRAISPGDTLDALPGAGSGQTTNSVKELCDVNGNPQNFNCNPPHGVPIKMAIWNQCVTKDGTSCAPGANMGYVVKYIGIFVLTRYSKGNGKDPVAQVEGYFTSMAASGSFSDKPSPLTMVALVQ